MTSRTIPRTRIPIDPGWDAIMTFRDFARQCCHQLRQWGYAEETLTVYDRTYMQFLASVKSRGGADDVRSFNDANVLGFAEDLGRRGIHPNTIIRSLSALSTLAKHGMMCRDAQERRLVREDPTKSFRWPTAQRQETRYVGPDDLRKLLEVQAPPYKALARDLLVETGLRVGEAARLNVDDLREADGRYYLAVKRKGRGQQRRQETRQVPLSLALGDALHKWVLLRGVKAEPHDPLLIHSDHGRWGRAALSNMVVRLAAAAGVTRRTSAHKLRHTANVIARLADVDMVTRSRLLGHTSIRSLERYEHVLPHELHEAREQQLDALRRYVGGAIPRRTENDREESETPRPEREQWSGDR